jgi:small-conductance mechanosensitive channel
MIAGRRRRAGLVLRSESAILLLGMMFLSSLALWVGVPLGWLWIGAHLQAETGSIGLAMFAMLVGMLASVAILVALLGWLGRKHIEILELRGREIGETTPLEQVLVGSAAIAVIAFGVWFFGFSGSAPLPGLELSY